MKNVSITPKGAEFDIEFDAERTVAGEMGRLIVQAFHVSAADKPGAKPRRISLGALPTIPFEVVSPQSP